MKRIVRSFTRRSVEIGRSYDERAGLCTLAIAYGPAHQADGARSRVACRIPDVPRELGESEFARRRSLSRTSFKKTPDDGVKKREDKVH